MANDLTTAEIADIQKKARFIKLTISRENGTRPEKRVIFPSDPEGAGPFISIGPLKTTVSFLDENKNEIFHLDAETNVPPEEAGTGLKMEIIKFLLPLGFELQQDVERKPSYVIYRLTLRTKKTVTKNP